MKTLFLGIFADCKGQKEVRKKVSDEFQADEAEVNRFDLLIAYVDYGSYEGTGWMLMREKSTGKLFMNHSGHCSCYGNEGQFSPEETSIQYLQSDKFSIYSYGNEEKEIKTYVNKLRNQKIV